MKMYKHLKFQDWDFAFMNLPFIEISFAFFSQLLVIYQWQLK